MAKTPSSMLPLGTSAPAFLLHDVISDKMISLEKHKGQIATVILFICNHCPYVKHINHALPSLAKDYLNQGVNFIAINSNDINQYPDDSPEHMRSTALELNYQFPYLYDETQEVAAAYHAACTPDFFIFNADLNLVYRGQFDDSRPGNHIPVTGNAIRSALDCLITNQPINAFQKPSLGCNIKWKKPASSI